jgi:putative ATPase
MAKTKKGLFTEKSLAARPLAVRMRPRTLGDFVGQEEVLGPGTYLRRAIEADRLQSLVLYGPPGTGKTTIAYIVSNATGVYFEALNAVMDGLPELKEVVKRARDRRDGEGRRTLLFVDEIHRFNKTQQDGLLPHVEDGLFIFIGATVHNPYFALTPALRSRSRIVRLRELSDDEIDVLVKRALADEENGLGAMALNLEPDAEAFILRQAAGDARRALSALEASALLVGSGGTITVGVAAEAAGATDVGYDRDEEGHYETISAYIKSIRGSDPDAALYWLARMLVGGEDPRFIARRLFILAAEDIGLADPQALLVAEAAFKAAEVIGMPEVQIILAEATIYCAASPKSNSSVKAIMAARKEVEEGERRSVPVHLKNIRLPGDEDDSGYKYPHSYPDGWADQEYLPGPPVRFYEPGARGYETKIKEYLEIIEKLKNVADDGLGGVANE